MPFELKTIEMRNDHTSVTIDVPSPLTLSTDEMSDLINQLAWVRTQMQPNYPNADPLGPVQLSPLEATRWYVRQHPEAPKAIELWLLHPGFGWIRIPLDTAMFDQLTQTGKLVLHNPATRQ